MAATVRPDALDAIYADTRALLAKRDIIREVLRSEFSHKAQVTPTQGTLDQLLLDVANNIAQALCDEPDGGTDEPDPALDDGDSNATLGLHQGVL